MNVCVCIYVYVCMSVPVPVLVDTDGNFDDDDDDDGANVTCKQSVNKPHSSLQLDPIWRSFVLK